ncbi:universal stress protein [Streptomyces sp. CA2R106]|uniref:universal stress protein n=1 Tax=Streptomyces sp. CA2R106 TaxID=3120153 RepID=UPI00300BBC30
MPTPPPHEPPGRHGPPAPYEPPEPGLAHRAGGGATVVAWVVEGTWPACVDAVRAHAPDGADVVLVHVAEPEVAGAAHGAFAGLLGRGRTDRDPGLALSEQATAAGESLLGEAAARLDRPCTTLQRTGRVEREVVAEAEDAALLVLARDGDRTRLGPHSLGPHSRFIVDHAPCPVLLVWPEPPPGPSTLPPPPPHPPGGPHPPHP